MALFEEQITDTLETSAPSIKYEGDEGPKSPEEQRMVQLKEEYMQYVFEQRDLQEPVMSFEEWYQAVYQASKMGVDAGQQPQPQNTMMRQPVAYGGIMGLGGRRQYGIGSSIKKRLRKLIPNEVAQVASMAAPFVAPFNPLIGGLMSGLGGFDKHGSLSRGLKSGLMTYGGGQLARGIGGAGPQWGLQSSTATGGGLGSYFTSPTSGAQLWGASKGSGISGGTPKPAMLGDTGGSMDYMSGSLPAGETAKNVIASQQKATGLSKINKFINDNSTAILLGSMGLAAATTKQEDVQEAMKASRGTGMDIDSIREEVRVAFESGPEAWNELKKKYPYIGGHETKKAAEGGIMRAGYYAGGQSVPSDYTMEDAMMTTTQDKLGGITDVMKQADLYRQGSVGQMYAAQGGRIGYKDGTVCVPKKAYPWEDREVAQEGGLMDLGGMEKDYRNDGGFVPLGGEEKADDVPARLSKNAFVFTADAVRGAGGGDIDKGAEIMENIMKNLEQGGQISEETQGLGGAQEMFDVSERLSEVV